jgi:hypothetical protein
MLAKLALVCVMLILPSSIVAQNAAPVASSPVKPGAPKPTPPKPMMATWSEVSESVLGISKDKFSSMGLSKLTSDEYLAIVSWAIDRETKLEEDAKATARAQTLTYTCGRTVTQADYYDKVTIYLDISDATPSELASRIRQDFRAMKDVQVVFSSKEADLKVIVIGFEVRAEINNQQTGYAASTTVTDSCVSKYGTNETNFDRYEANYLMTSGRNPASLAEDITTSVDTKDLEPQRRLNAALKKLMQGK